METQPNGLGSCQPATLPPSGAKRVVIAVNPRAGRQSSSERASHLAELLRQNHLDVRICHDLAEIAELANRWQADGELRALVGIGGDGTAAELTNRTNPRTPLTFLACGTANILSKHVGLCHRPQRLCETILAGRVVQLDAGRVGERLFLSMFGCGFDAEVVQRMHRLRSSLWGGHISYFSYLKPIWQSLRSYDYPEIHIQRDDGAGPFRENSVVDAKWAFVFNLPRYGWGMSLVPQAVPDDGLLDLCVLGHGSCWAVARYAVFAQLGRLGKLPDCRIDRGSRFRITADRPVSYQLDGDPGGVLPVEVEVLPRRLTLLVPRSYSVAGGRSGREGL